MTLRRSSCHQIIFSVTLQYFVTVNQNMHNNIKITAYDMYATARTIIIQYFY